MFSSPGFSMSASIISIAVLFLSGCSNEDTMRQSPQVLAEHAAWTWFNDERAIIADSLLFIGYVDTSGYSSTSVFSLKSKMIVQNYRLGSFIEKDDHNNPAFVHLGNRTVLAAYAPHHTQPYWYRRFARITEAGDVKWSKEHKSDSLNAFTTYSNLFRLTGEQGRLYNFYRGTNFDPVFTISDNKGQNWNPEQHFISSGGQYTRPYVKYASNGIDRIDFLFTQAHPRDAETNIYHTYYRKGNLYKSDGTLIQPMPATNQPPMPVDDGTLIYDARENGRAWVWDLEYSTDGSPVAVFVSAADSTIGNDLRYHYARWDQTDDKWHESEIAYAGTRLYTGENHYAGGITLDPANPGIVYISSDVHPVSKKPTQHYQLYRGTTKDSGESWSWTVLTPEAKEDNIRPFVPRGVRNSQIVLWLRGRYTTYQDYDMKIVGLIE